MPVSAVRARDYSEEAVSTALDEAFALLGLEVSNPFAEIVEPGNQVFIKPNWVADRYRASCQEQHDVFTTITHPAVIRAIALRVDRALQGRGRIIIGDNPSIDADFSKLMEVQRLENLRGEIKAEFEIVDLRPLVCTDLRHYGNRDKMQSQPGDPRGETVINLGRDSRLFGLNPHRFRGVFDDRTETIKAHSGETQLYGFSNSIFGSDVFISIPKLKTHHKVGTTLNLKGLVGTVGTKNYLVHWREGFPAIGGDAYPGFWAWFFDRFRRVKNRGAWCGNDTIWRMVVDLHTGIRRGPKRFFTVIDGILGGEGNGPFCPEPNEAKTLIVGTDFLEADLVATRLMGFDPHQIPYLNYYLQRGEPRLEEIDFRTQTFEAKRLADLDYNPLRFKPPKHWPAISNYYAASGAPS